MYVGMRSSCPTGAYPVAHDADAAGLVPGPRAPPGTPPHHRYWDGAGWTPHVQPVYPAYAQPVQPAYAQPVQPRIVAGPTTPDGERLAGWWWRALAQVIDIVILGVAGNIVALPVQIQVQREIADLTDRYVRDISGRTGRPSTSRATGRRRWTSTATTSSGCSSSRCCSGWPTSACSCAGRAPPPGSSCADCGSASASGPGGCRGARSRSGATVQHLIPGMAVAALILSGSLATMVLGYLGVTAYFLVDVLWAAVSKKRQAVHDIAAETNVVTTR